MLKKTVTVITALFILILFSSVFNAEEDKPFTVNINGKDLVKDGDTVVYSVTIDEIKPEDGIIGADIYMAFDSSVLQYQSHTASSVDKWNMDVNVKSVSNGIIELHPAENDGNINNAIKENGKIKFEITFKVLPTEEMETLFGVSEAVANLDLYTTVKGQFGSLSIRIKHFLATPENLSWDGNTATWDAVNLAAKYSVQLYRGGKAYGSAIDAETNSADFSSITEAGRYTFTVTAVSESEELGDSSESAQSAEHVIRGALVSPSAKLTSDITSGGLKYQITDTNPDGTVSGYTVTLYNEAGEAVLSEETSSKAGTFPLGENVTGGEKYTVSVSAKSADTEIYDDSPESEKSEAVEAARLVESIAYGSAPGTTYTEGAALNLTGVTVVLSYSDGTSKTVAFRDFDKYGITMNMSNGQKLEVSDTGKSIVATFGSGKTKKTASSAKITVNSSACKHSNTRIERKEPTCGENGYENVICADCGETISSTDIPATQLHSFGEWVVTVNPTGTLKGTKTRTCTVCGHYETEEIPALGTTTSNEQNPPSSTSSDSGQTTSDVRTNPPVVTDKPGKTSDLSRIFLIALIVIFIIIIIIIAASILAERKREQERKRRAAQRRKRSGQ